jgi:hypothetical protein
LVEVHSSFFQFSGRDVDPALLRAHTLEKKPEDEKSKLTVVAGIY